MRTLNNIKNRITFAVYGEVKYHVSGEILIHMSSGAEPDLCEIDQKIKNTDATFPWHNDDENCVMGYKHYDVEVTVEGPVHKRATCSLSVNLRKGQIYAYERYLATLAEELSKKFNKSAVEYVSYRMKVESLGHFTVK